VGDEKASGRKRAVGTRDRVMKHLLVVGEVRDAGGMASTVLAEAIAYPGSSIAFAQLLSGMQRSGLIEREVRGKRTYRIAPVKTELARPAGLPRGGRGRKGGQQASRVAASQQVGQVAASQQSQVAAAAGAEDFDYDELARRLLRQVVQRLGEPGQEPEEEAAAGAGSDALLARTVASLEHKLATVRSKQRRLTEENAKLREQLRAAQESLAQAHESAGAGRLDSAEVRLLERLLLPLRDKGTQQEEAGTG
jgi:chromosome segregation ATPase